MIIKEKRADARIPINKSFRGIVKDAFKDFEIVNLSKGGTQLLIKNGLMSDRVTPQAPIKMKLFYKIREAYGEENLNVTGIIKWRKEIAETFYHRVGVQFNNLDEYSTKKLSNFLESFMNNKIARMDCILA